MPNVIISITTMIAIASIMFDLSTFEVALDLVVNIKVFYVYFPECLRRTLIKIVFSSAVYTVVLCFEGNAPVL